jgi:hypothetical protein
MTYAEDAKHEIIRCSNEVLTIGKEFVTVLRPQLERAQRDGDEEKLRELNARAQVLVEVSQNAVARVTMLHAILKAMSKK